MPRESGESPKNGIESASNFTEFFEFLDSEVGDIDEFWAETRTVDDDLREKINDMKEDVGRIMEDVKSYAEKKGITKEDVLDFLDGINKSQLKIYTSKYRTSKYRKKIIDLLTSEANIVLSEKQ